MPKIDSVIAAGAARNRQQAAIGRKLHCVDVVIEIRKGPRGPDLGIPIRRVPGGRKRESEERESDLEG